jgi:long-chain fatty acid transport protein
MGSHSFIKRVALISSLSLLTGISSNAMAAYSDSFAHNASGLGYSYVGTEAITEDASYQFYNPAILTSFTQQQFNIGGLYAAEKKTFNGSTSYVPYAINQSGTASASGSVEVPFFYYVLPFQKRFAFGLGISAIGGTGQVYPDNSILRYTSTRSFFGIVSASPALAAAVCDNFSVGAGLDVNYIWTQLNSMASSYPPGGADSKIQNSANNIGYGWHAGILYKLSPATRIGLAYRSKVNFNPSGDSEYILNPGTELKTEFTTNNFNYAIATAPITSLSLYHSFNDKWALMTGVSYTQWSLLHAVTFYNIATPIGALNLPAQLNFHNTWFFGVAGNYQATEKWLLKAGIAYDQDQSDHRVQLAESVVTPIMVRVAFGARYQANKDASIDMGYSHSFYQNTNIGYTSAVNTQSGTLKVYDANVVGIQLNYNV